MSGRRRKGTGLRVCLALFLFAFAGVAAAQGTTVRGELGWPGISGAALIRGDRLLLVGSEGVRILPNAAAALKGL